MRVRDEGVWRDVVRARAYVEGAWRELNEVKSFVDGDFEIVAEFVDDMSVSVLNDSIVAGRFGAGFAVSPPVVAAPNGGRGPYTYQWTIVSGAPAAITSPNASTTSFSFFVNSDQVVSGVYRCTVTDDLGATASVDVTVQFIGEFIDGIN